VSPQRARTFRLLSWLVLVVLAVHPVGMVDAACEVLVAPFRLVAEAVTPLAALRSGEVRAAESQLARRATVEQQENAGLLRDLALFALPSEPALLVGRRAVPGEVLARETGSRDRLRVLVSDARGVVLGLPVTCGDAYAGRVVELVGTGYDHERGGEREVVVQLITDGDAVVGARVADGPGGDPVQLTVGGVWTRRGPDRGSRDVHLAVQNPSDRELSGGVARVYEPLSIAADPVHARLATGFLLGTVERHADGGASWSVRPALDYVDGLFQVAILAPVDDSLPEPAPPSPVHEDGHWIPARVLGPGPPEPGRRTVNLAQGAVHGVRRGAAVTFGARLMGRVTRVGPISSTVSLLGDPGLTLVAAARIRGEVEPRVLGRLVGLGRDPDTGAALFRWHRRTDHALVPGADGSRRALLFTGSGEPGLRGGFHLGWAEIPVGPGGAERPLIRLEVDVDPARVRALWVRVEPPLQEVR
jgi:hypothetical protein